MPVELTQSVAAGLREYFERREGEVLSLVRGLVETESPSGDVDGNRAVVALLTEAAQGIEGVEEVKESFHPDYGSHLLVRAFADE
ncbi:MAG TPA: hypothetical protein VJT82_09150, partial [Pyrinomonadaceae bacterium]|nr:hypothetical protein [Pyrinomonadaceae bacterium]